MAVQSSSPAESVAQANLILESRAVSTPTNLAKKLQAQISRSLYSPVKLLSDIGSDTLARSQNPEDRKTAAAVKMLFVLGISPQAFQKALQQAQLRGIKPSDPSFRLIAQMQQATENIRSEHTTLANLAQQSSPEREISIIPGLDISTVQPAQEVNHISFTPAPTQSFPQVSFTQTQGMIKSISSPLLESGAKRATSWLGKKALGTAAGKAVTTAVTQVAAKVGLSAAFGAASGGVSIAIQAGVLLLKKTFGKIFSKIGIWFKKQRGGVAIPSALIIGGLALGAPALTALGTGALVVTTAGGALTTGGAFVATFMAGLFVLGTAIGTSLAIAIGSLIVLFSIIFFIIRSGAFLLPPSPEDPSLFSSISGEPIEGLCLPSSGRIKQLQFCGNCYSHQNLNAYDIANSLGTPIYAVHDGIASSHLDTDKYGHPNRYGYYIKVRSTDGKYQTIYGHMTPKMVIPLGTRRDVQKGDLIGRIDDSGYSDGNHLHFELRSLSGPNLNIASVFGQPATEQLVANCFNK